MIKLVPIVLFLLLQACATRGRHPESESSKSPEVHWQEQMQIDELFLKKANQAPNPRREKPRTSAAL